MKMDWIIVIVVFYISCEIMCCLCNAKKCLRMFKSVSILIFDQNSINGRYFQRPRGILEAIISVTEGLNSLGTLYIARFHKYAPLLRDPKMIPSCSRCVVLIKRENYRVFSYPGYTETRNTQLVRNSHWL